MGLGCGDQLNDHLVGDQRPARMCWRDDLVTVLLSGWRIIGLFIDGWAHNTRTRSPAPPRRRLGVPGYSWWAKGDLNPHPLAGTWPSTMRVCLFRHSPMLQMQALVSPAARLHPQRPNAISTGSPLARISTQLVRRKVQVNS
jgi:hypothetical protein